MIAYDLKCNQGHTFEGWFEDDRSYKSQKRKGMLTCPVCYETEVNRVPSTFAIKSTGNTTQSVSTAQVNLDQVGKKMVDFVESNFDNVGCEFAKEALKIHYGASEPRSIRGTSTPEEEKTLKKEGIDFIKIPLPQQPESDS
ncbi:MAG: DUF1178 family protein [Desulfobacterales bacterium]|nr:DUF1178 family protein [Desulfobacterales bacterium]